MTPGTQSFFIRIGSSRGNLSVLLTLCVNAHAKATRYIIRGILSRTLASTLLFQHDPEEVELWLRCLPYSRNASGVRSATATALADEAEVVISFLEDCIQRCMKTPFRYLEELQTLANQSYADTRLAIAGHPGALPSPVLMTVIEQLEAKYDRELLSAVDSLAVVIFVRKLILKLTGKVYGLELLSAIALRLESITKKAGRSADTADIAHHVHAISIGLSQLQRPTQNPEKFSSTVQEVLETIQNCSPSECCSNFEIIYLR